MRIFDTPRRHLRRTVLPPHLLGLVTFSFALLGSGGVTYAASLPALIQAAQHAGEHGIADVFVEGLLGSGAPGGAASQGAGPDGGAQPGEPVADGTASPEAGTAGGFTLGGVTFEQVISGVVGDSSSSSPDAPAPSGASGSTGSAGSASGGSASGGSSGAAGGAPAPAPEPAPPAEVPTEPAVTEDQERQFHSALSASAGRINGYVGEINGITSGFNNDCMADRGTRERRLVEARGLRDRLFNEYMHARDGILVANESRYKNAQGDLIRMYRLLTEYASVVTDAWENNTADEPGDVNGLLASIRAAQNNQLAEFQQVHGRFSL